MHGKLATVIDQIEHGHHVFRAYFKSGFLKQYEKFLTFLRNELVSNNLADFGLLKGLDHLDAVRTTFQLITDRFAGFQAEWLNVHVDFPLLQRLAHPITIGAVRYPGLKIHEPRIIRLFEVLTQGRPSRPPLPLLPQAPVRPPRQQPLPSPAGPATPSRQPARSRLSPRRHRHPTRRRSLGCSLIAPRLNDNVQLVLSMIPQVRI